MPTLEELIINEAHSLIGHMPTVEELNSLSAFIAGRKIRFLIDIELAAMDWKRDCTKECAWCGDRFLESEMAHHEGDIHFCCDRCEEDYKEEHKVA